MLKAVNRISNNAQRGATAVKYRDLEGQGAGAFTLVTPLWALAHSVLCTTRQAQQCCLLLPCACAPWCYLSTTATHSDGPCSIPPGACSMLHPTTQGMSDETQNRWHQKPCSRTVPRLAHIYTCLNASLKRMAWPSTKLRTPHTHNRTRTRTSTRARTHAHTAPCASCTQYGPRGRAAAALGHGHGLSYTWRSAQATTGRTEAAAVCAPQSIQAAGVHVHRSPQPYASSDGPAPCALDGRSAAAAFLEPLATGSLVSF
mmetsp:Transcript_40368/g.91463  ORF Transcript_40368/g.91463 Transcript_40368/m.91463 type:complete len:258 (-) Transcript_40368:3323-4096(-)